MAHALLNRATLCLAAGMLAAMTGGAVADRVLTDPASGQRLLLRDDGTYRLLPPAGGGSSGAQSSAPDASRQPSAPGASTVPPGGGSASTLGGASGSMQNAPRTGGAEMAAGSAVPSYPSVSFEEIATIGSGQRVSLDGWIGSFGTGDRFLMFRDRTVSPPFVVVRMSEDAIGAASRPASTTAPTASSSRAAEDWATDVNDRCRQACAVRIQGEVFPAPPGGAPELVAHHVDVSR